MKDLFGIDLTPFKGTLCEHFSHIREKCTHGILSARWTILCFGWKQSPELYKNYYYLAEEFVRGDHLEIGNPLRWDEVILNLMGNNNSNPALPNVYK